MFVPHPQGQAEDHGWLITFTYNEISNRSELIVVDAQNFT